MGLMASFIVIPAQNDNILIRQFALVGDDHDRRIDIAFRIDRPA